MKVILIGKVFGTPKMHPKSKPFIDHVLMFGITGLSILFTYLFLLTITGSKVWFRNYQIVEEFMPHNPSDQKEETTLMELGPRFVLNLIKILDGSFTGQVIYENPHFVPPNMVRFLEMVNLVPSGCELMCFVVLIVFRSEQRPVMPNPSNTSKRWLRMRKLLHTKNLMPWNLM